MRPPAIQAERNLNPVAAVADAAASMRPPAIQAERRPPRSSGLRHTHRFNEAACNTGGTRE